MLNNKIINIRKGNIGNKVKFTFAYVFFIFAIPFAIGQDSNDSLKAPFNCSCRIDMFEGQNIFTIVEKMPEYPSGSVGMMKFLQDNINLRNENEELQPSIYFSFVIDTAGNVTNKCVKPRYSDHLTQSEKSALDALDKMEKWVPGEQNGKKVLVKYTIPVKILIR